MKEFNESSKELQLIALVLVMISGSIKHAIQIRPSAILSVLGL